jgi:hypothetical protein
MEEKEEQLLHAAEFGQALLQRTEELQEENETIARAAEEHEYRAKELKRNLDQLAEEAAEKESALERARLSLALREQEVEERMQSLEGTEAEKAAQVVEAQEEAEAAKADAAQQIAQLKAQATEIQAREAEMREAREEEERQRVAVQKKQREAEEQLAKQKELQQRQSDTMRQAARQLEAERAQKKQIETQLTEERKAAEERLEREKRDLLMRSTADFHRMREMVATPGQVFSPDGMDDPDVLQSPSLRESVERTESSERHKIETSELAERNRELERKLAEASDAPPPSPTGSELEPEPEPKPEQDPDSVLAQAKACLTRGNEHMNSHEMEEALEGFEAGLQLLDAEAAPGAEQPQDEDGTAPETVPAQSSPGVAALRAELEERRSRAQQLLDRKETEFKLRLLLEKGRENMTGMRYSSALTAFKAGLQLCSEASNAALRKELQAEEAKAVKARAEQKGKKREETQQQQEATKRGWLWKKGDKFKAFKKRFFVLDHSGPNGASQLEYFEREGGDSKGFVDLSGLTFDAVRPFTTDNMQFQIVTSAGRTFDLLAPSYRDRQRWAAAIHWAIDPVRAREEYGDGKKYQEWREEEEGMYVVLSVTQAAAGPGEDASSKTKTYYEVRVRHHRRITSVSKRYSDFDELHTHLNKTSQEYKAVLSGHVLSHDMGVTVNFLGAAGQGGGLEFPKKTWFDSSGSDADIINERKEKLSRWLQRVVMIEGLKDEPQLLEFIGAQPSRDTIVTPREDRDAPPWESEQEFELLDATAELRGVVEQLIRSDVAEAESGDGDGGSSAWCMENLAVTSVQRVHNKVLWEDFRRRQDTIRHRGMQESTPQLGDRPTIQQWAARGYLSAPRAAATAAGGGGGGGGGGAAAAAAAGGGGSQLEESPFTRVVDDTDVNELRLWHGTNVDTAETLVQYGFGLSDTNGRYGAGDYFSDCSSTAQEHCNRTATAPAASGGEMVLDDAEDGIHTMLLCRVTCGAPYLTATTHQGDRRPPPNAANHNLPFDSIFAEMGVADGGKQQHNEVVVFNGQQVYPELLVHYTAKPDVAL